MSKIYEYKFCFYNNMHFLRKTRIQNTLGMKDRCMGKIFSVPWASCFSLKATIFVMIPLPAQKCHENIVSNLGSYKSICEPRFLLHQFFQKNYFEAPVLIQQAPKQRNSQKLTGCSCFNVACATVYMHTQTCTHVFVCKYTDWVQLFQCCMCNCVYAHTDIHTCLCANIHMQRDS